MIKYQFFSRVYPTTETLMYLAFMIYFCGLTTSFPFAFEPGEQNCWLNSNFSIIWIVTKKANISSLATNSYTFNIHYYA